MGYSNVAGDLNVYSDTSTSTLTVRNGAIFNGGLVATSCVVTFGNVVAANLTVTGNFTVTATNTQVSNSLSINNFGTATAIKVVQYEGGGPGHVHNVAEFWDYQTLAMVIDPEGNVGIHTGISPGYAFTVVDGAFIDTLTLTNPLAVSSGGTGVATTTQNYVFAGPQFGSGAPDFRYLVNSDLPSSISVSNISGNGYGLYSLLGSNVTGTVADATVALVVSQAAQPNITSVGLLSNLAVSNSITTTNLVANTLTLVNATASITGNLYVSNSVSTTNAYLTGSLNVQGVSNLGDVYALRYFGDGGLLSNITSFVQPVANLVVSNAVTTTNLFANTLTLANATASITGNLYVSNAVTTTNLFANTLTLANATASITGNLYVSNAITTTNLFANTLTLANATASITGNL